MVMGYLINEGYPEAARKFASEANIQPPEAAAATSGEREEIKHAILAGSIELAIERINDLTDVSICTLSKIAAMIRLCFMHHSHAHRLW